MISIGSNIFSLLRVAMIENLFFPLISSGLQQHILSTTDVFIVAVHFVFYCHVSLQNILYYSSYFLVVKESEMSATIRTNGQEILQLDSHPAQP